MVGIRCRSQEKRKRTRQTRGAKLTTVPRQSCRRHYRSMYQPLYLTPSIKERRTYSVADVKVSTKFPRADLDDRPRNSLNSATLALLLSHPSMHRLVYAARHENTPPRNGIATCSTMLHSRFATSPWTQCLVFAASYRFTLLYVSYTVVTSNSKKRASVRCGL